MRIFAQKQRPIQKDKSASPARTSRAFSDQNREAAFILHLQRLIGNQAVQRLLEANTHHDKGDSTTTEIARFGHDFTRISLYPTTPPRIKPRMMVNAPDDKYEQEADRVADAVMRMPEPRVQRQVEPEEEEEETLQSKPLVNQITPLVQVQRQEEPEEEEEEEIQPKSLAGPAPEVTPEMGRDIQSIKGVGQPLSASERAFFEPRFGVDFDDVRVHSDTPAAHVARSVNARAFTLGRDVVFGTGQYAPGMSERRRLLAHELTHVVQQSIKK